MSIKVCVLNYKHCTIPVLKDDGVGGLDFVTETEDCNPLKFLSRFGVLRTLLSRFLL